MFEVGFVLDLMVQKWVETKKLLRRFMDCFGDFIWLCEHGTMVAERCYLLGF